MASAFFFCCGSSLAAPPKPTLTPVPRFDVRIAVGSNQAHSDKEKRSWASDRSFNGTWGYTDGGQAASNNQPVSATNDPGLYQAYRAGAHLAYKMKAPAGRYMVILKFADFTSTAAGQNVLNVASQGQTVIGNLDVYASAGHALALDKVFQATVDDSGFLTVELTAVTGQAFLSALEVKGLQPLDGGSAKGR